MKNKNVLRFESENGTPRSKIAGATRSKIAGATRSSYLPASSSLGLHFFNSGFLFNSEKLRKGFPHVPRQKMQLKRFWYSDEFSLYNQNLQNADNFKLSALNENSSENSSSRGSVDSNARSESTDSEHAGSENPRHTEEKPPVLKKLKRGSKLNFVQAPTGSGKTYNMIQHALNLASVGRIVVLSFPNKNLVNENSEILDRELESPKWNIHNIKKINLTLDEDIGPRLLLNIIPQGGLIINTLHVYLQPKGVNLEQTDLSYLTYIFRANVVVFIDESHLFLDNLKFDHEITNLYYSDFGNTPIIYSNGFLLNKESHKTLKTLDIAPREFTSVQNRYGGSRFVDESRVTNKDCPTIFDKNELFDLKSVDPHTLKASLNPEIQNDQTKLEADLIDECSSFEEQTNVNIGEIKENRLSLQAPHLKIVRPAIYTERNFQVFRILMGENFDIHIKNKERTIKKVIQIFHLNAFRSFVKNNECLDLTKRTLEFLSNPTTEKRNELLNFGSQIFKNQIQNLKNSATQNSPNFPIKKQLQEHFDEGWMSFLNEYPKVCQNSSLEFEIKTQTSLDALIVLCASSINVNLISFYPEKDGIQICDLEKFKVALNQDLKSKKTNQQQRYPSELETSESGENNIQTETSLSFPSEVVFTSKLVGTQVFPLFGILQLRQNVFLTATPNLKDCANLATYFSQRTSFGRIKSTLPKLNRLLVFFSNINYFNSYREPWKQMWGTVAQYFSNNNTKSRGELALLVMPSNSKAEQFFNLNLPQKSHLKRFFSLVKARSEVFLYEDEATFTAQGSQQASFCFRVCSVFSTVSVGLNLPNHKFMIVGLNNFKPIPTLYEYGAYNVPLMNANHYEALSSVIQNVGRDARFAPDEVPGEGKEPHPSIRVKFFHKADTYPGGIYPIFESLAQQYEEAILVDINPLENKIGNRSKASIEAFQLYQDHLSNHIKEQLFPTQVSETLFAQKPFLIQFPPGFDFSSTEDFRAIFLMKMADCLSPCTIHHSIHIPFNRDFLTRVLTQVKTLVWLLLLSNLVLIEILASKKLGQNFSEQIPKFKPSLLKKKYNTYRLEKDDTEFDISSLFESLSKISNQMLSMLSQLNVAHVTNLPLEQSSSKSENSSSYILAQFIEQFKAFQKAWDSLPSEEPAPKQDLTSNLNPGEDSNIDVKHDSNLQASPNHQVQDDFLHPNIIPFISSLYEAIFLVFYSNLLEPYHFHKEYKED